MWLLIDAMRYLYVYDAKCYGDTVHLTETMLVIWEAWMVCEGREDNWGKEIYQTIRLT